ncbi:hypothetical protein KAW96_03780 [candidate division WOR-3 bacterium]|nr:hypothetical protein [candidate division WOR-3 bacterium]
MDEFKIPLNPVRWRNLSNGVNPPLEKGDIKKKESLKLGKWKLEIKTLKAKDEIATSLRSSQ